MFGNSYQNGPCFEVWDSRVNTDKNVFYKQLFRMSPPNIKKYFDKQAKSFLYSLDHQNSKLILPSDQHKNLSLHQQYLVIQLFVPYGSNWSLELGFTDTSNIKRRINITTTPGKEQLKYFSLRYPIDNLTKNVWLFLGIDIYSFMTVFKDMTFRSLDHVCVNSQCRIRRIFTMKEWIQWEIPKSYWMGGDVQQQLQLLQYQNKQNNISQSVRLENSSIKEKKSQKKISKSKSKPKEIDKFDKISKLVEYSPKIKKQQIKSSIEPGLIIQKAKPTRLMKSEVIIKNAKSKINNLQKMEEQLKDRSIRFNENYRTPVVKNTKLNNKSIKSYRNSKEVKQFTNRQIQQKSLKKSAPPIFQKQFKEDVSNYSQSSNAVPPKISTPYRQEQIIEQDKWSQESRHIETGSTPISEAIITQGQQFPNTTITKQNGKEIRIIREKPVELQLIYDEMVGCYYHAQTNTYFQMKQ